MRTYPDYMPTWLMSGYSQRSASPMMRSALGGGRASQRAAYKSVPVAIKIETIMNYGQAQAFEVFFRWAIRDGADWFLCRVKTSHGVVERQCRFVGMYDGPNPITPTLCRVTGEIEMFDRDL